MRDHYLAALRSLLAACAVLCLMACTEAAPDLAAQKQDAMDAFNAYVTNLNAGDYEAAAEIYDDGPDFHWIERGGVQYASGAEAAASLRSFSGQTGTASMTVDEMMAATLSDGAVLITAHFTFAMANPDGTPQFSFDGWMTAAMTRRVNGWRIASGQVGPGS
ncbi:YybH family protein [Kordiimonas aquimaris]|uniref:YybH family protein n=1 Tax=Kordiimonas aquimaris TaxID=707591 RepID=UPI0021D054EA|nr:nuclear transport factor 2 family protein [Kordiimonas aquimaris]